MKILILGGELSYRGTGIYTLNLVEELHTQGHSVKIICAGGKLVDEFISLKIPIDVYPPLTQPGEEIFSFSSFFNKANPAETDYDIIHLHLQHHHLAGLAARLAQHFKKPYLITVPHTLMVTGKLKINQKWLKNIIVTTESAREYLVNESKIPKDIIEVVYAGVNPDRLKPMTDSGEKKKKMVIGITGPLEEWRGHRYFLQAAKQILDSGYNVQFLIIGEGNLENELRQLKINLGIQKSVTFIPSINTYYQALPEVDIFVFPIRQMGIGITLLEAMALSRPVIVSAISDIYRLIKDGETGYLIPPDNPEAIKEKVVSILKDPAGAGIIGKSAREFVRTHFTAKEMAAQTISLYKKAMPV